MPKSLRRIEETLVYTAVAGTRYTPATGKTIRYGAAMNDAKTKLFPKVFK